MSWEDEDCREWLQPWEEPHDEDGWPEEQAGPEYGMAWWCMVSTDGDFYAPRARWVSSR